MWSNNIRRTRTDTSSKKIKRLGESWFWPHFPLHGFGRFFYGDQDYWDGKFCSDYLESDFLFHGSFFLEFCWWVKEKWWYFQFSYHSILLFKVNVLPFDRRHKKLNLYQISVKTILVEDWIDTRLRYMTWKILLVFLNKKKKCSQ